MINTDKLPQREQFFLQLLMLAAMAFTLINPVFTARETGSRQAAAESDMGVGGGMVTGQVVPAGTVGEALEILGDPEPIELSRPKILVYDSYKVVKGDTISQIAVSTGLNEDTLLSVNQIKNSRLLQIGQILKIPNQDGIYYTTAGKDTLASVAETYQTDPETIKTANELFTDTITKNISLFIPGARMDWVNRQEINGDLFIWPVNGYITSLYGYRDDPFGRGWQFHNGLDIGVPAGTTIKAAMAGRVAFAGYDDSYGNYIIISHHSGYRTLYAHLSVISVKSGAYVAAGEKIGLVGTTGLSTGPHLHFTVFKDGVTVNPRALMK
ncbi:MAG: M23 family metallopeptidase [Treponema sp.]|nr:M23 family metallopeptidase [Treponema sp.]